MHMSMHMSMHMPIHMSVHTSAHIHTGTHVGTRVYTHVYTHVDTRMQNCACTRQCPCLCRRVSVSMSPHKSRHLPAHVSEHMPMPVFVSPSIRHVHMPFIYTGCVARHLPHSTQGPRVYSDGLYSYGRVRGAAPSAQHSRPSSECLQTSRPCRRVCIDMCTDMCTDMCIDVCIDMRWSCARHRWKALNEAVIFITGTSVLATIDMPSSCSEMREKNRAATSYESAWKYTTFSDGMPVSSRRCPPCGS